MTDAEIQNIHSWKNMFDAYNMNLCECLIIIVIELLKITLIIFCACIIALKIHQSIDESYSVS